MATLNHVCIWSEHEHGWRRIDVYEALKIFPGGVSANSKVLMCELCGQYVTLANGRINTAYFRHSSSEANKNCPERADITTRKIGYEQYEFPIRIKDITSKSFQFDIGLTRDFLDKLDTDSKVSINTDNIKQKFEYAQERFNLNGITYLSVGNKPSENYRIYYNEKMRNKVKECWLDVKGIDPKGTLFKKTSGRKLKTDADVTVGKEYYLLKKGRISCWEYGYGDSGVQVTETARINTHLGLWILYTVLAEEMTKEAGNFFLQYHCRLTDRPVKLRPIWPLYIEENYIIHTNQDDIWIAAEGNVSELTCYPYNVTEPFYVKKDLLELYKVSCLTKQQQISAGRSSAFEFLYVQKSEFVKPNKSPKFSVRDVKDQMVQSGIQNQLPELGILRIKVPYDAELKVSHNNSLINIIKCRANKIATLDGLRFGDSVQIFIGLDCIWNVEFKQENVQIPDIEIKLLKQLKDSRGPLIKTPHALNNILYKMNGYPKITEWIRKCLRSKKIYRNAYLILKDFCIEQIN